MNSRGQEECEGVEESILNTALSMKKANSIQFKVTRGKLNL